MKRPLTDPYDLQRFVSAQENEIEDVFAELVAGRKAGHWMWYIFPQIEGLGRTSTSREFAICSLAEAEAYLAHPLLGPRIRKCSQLVTEIQQRTIDSIFGSPDKLKFRSSMTLFAHATSDNEVFLKAIKKYYNGEFDPLTLKWLAIQTRGDRG